MRHMSEPDFFFYLRGHLNYIHNDTRFYAGYISMKLQWKSVNHRLQTSFVHICVEASEVLVLFHEEFLVNVKIPFCAFWISAYFSLGAVCFNYLKICVRYLVQCHLFSLLIDVSYAQSWHTRFISRTDQIVRTVFSLITNSCYLLLI